MFRSPSRTSAKTGVAPAWTITFAVAGHVIGVVITSSPGPTPSASSARCSAAVPDATRERRASPRRTRRSAPRAPPCAAPSSASRSGASPRRRRSPPRRSRAAGSERNGSPSYARASASTSAVTKRMRSAAAVGPRQRLRRGCRRPRASRRPGPRRRRSGAEDAARRAVDPDPRDPFDRERLVDALDRAQLAGRRDEEARHAPPTRACGASTCAADRLAERGRERERVQVDAERGAAELRVVPAAEPRGELDDLRALRADDDLRVGRPVRDPERGRSLRAASTACGDLRRRCAHGQTCASATPNAGGSASCRSVTVSAWNRPPSEKRVDRHLLARRRAPRRGTTPPATPRAPRRPRPRARLVARTSDEPALALPVRRLHDAREAEPLDRVARLGERSCTSRCAAAATPASREALALARPSTSRACATSRRERVRRAPSRSATRAAIADRPVDPRRDHAVDALGLGEPLDPRLVLGRDDRAAVREREAGRAGIAVDRDHEQVRARARLRAARAAPAPAPRTRRRCAPLARTALPPRLILAVPGDRAREPSSKDVRARQPVSSLAFSVEPMWRSTWPGRSGTCVFRSRGLPSASSTLRRCRRPRCRFRSRRSAPRRRPARAAPR